MALPTIYWFSKMGEYGAKLIPLVASIVAWFAWCYNVVALLIVVPLNVIRAAFGAIDVAWTQLPNWQGFAWIALVNSILPLSEGFALLSAYWSFCLTVVILRWVKSFIPTISN